MIGAIVAWCIAILVVVAVVVSLVAGRRRRRNDGGTRSSLMDNERMAREAELQRGQSQSIDKVRQIAGP